MAGPEKPDSGETFKFKIKPNNLPKNWERGASIGLNRKSVTEINPFFYAERPPEKADGRSELKKTQTTVYYTPIFYDKIDEKKLKMEGAGLHIAADGVASVLDYKGNSFEPIRKNMRGRVGPGINETLTTYRSIAVDKNVIPLGAWVYVDFGGQHSYTGWYKAEDIGGAIKGNHIDIFVGVGEENYKLGDEKIPSKAKRVVWFKDGRIHGKDGPITPPNDLVDKWNLQQEVIPK